jgi:CNT family concentrative nucleoside transporter
MVLNYLIALFVLKTAIGVSMFSSFSLLITNFLKMSESGLTFLFGQSVLEIHNFAVAVLPAIGIILPFLIITSVFFCSFISVVYYFGGMQYLVAKMAWLMVRLMDTSGAESVVAAASPFVGQGESALLVKPFVEYMTNSELHSTMTSGFATIAGSVLLAYQQYLNDTSAILTACIMSVPTSLAVSKMRLPEKEQSMTKGNVTIPENEEQEANFLHAAGNGAATGVNLILLIGGALLSIVSLFAVADYLFGWAFFMIDVYDTFNGPVAGVNVRVSIKLALSFLFFPVAWLIGIKVEECRKAAEFMGLKMVVNEFVAYEGLNSYAIKADKTGYFDPRTVKLLAFALCGFANVASIGIQIGCLTAMAPSRGRDLAKLAFSAMLTGTVSTWLCAAVAGSII